MGRQEERALLSAGAEVTWVRGSAHAYDALRTDRWDIVIVDHIEDLDPRLLEEAAQGIRRGFVTGLDGIGVFGGHPPACMAIVLVAANDLSDVVVDAARVALGLVRAPLPVRESSSSRRIADLRLSRRQREYVKLLLGGSSQKEISTAMQVSESTVRFHAAALYRRCGVSNQRELLLLLGRTGAG
ncbi:MAG TPA: LuxR C-terminal-related transcriptional regulator [Polyangiaceae bacterium]|nr:LuxR C-terminal-related transcriptional regulator [Polyangiaceae bacterium]